MGRGLFLLTPQPEVRGEAKGGMFMPCDIKEAERMLNLFTSVGARSFVVTKILPDVFHASARLGEREVIVMGLVVNEANETDAEQI